MGTRFEVVVRTHGSTHARAAGEAALQEIQYWHDRLSIFDKSSFLSFINANAFAGPVELDAELFALLSLCEEAWLQSGGAFDPTVASEMVRRGLHDRPSEGDGPVGLDAVVLDASARTIRFTREGVSLDLGGVAKGFALDRAAEVLQECGISHAFLHGGTSSGIALGAGDDGGTPWCIALASDEDAPCIELFDSAYSVSSPSGRVVNETHHILDPRGGAVEMDRCAAVWSRLDVESVIGLGAASCDAWSTALVVLGQRPGAMPERLASAVREQGVWDESVNIVSFGAAVGAV